MNAKIRNDAHEAEAALLRHGEHAHARAVRKLLQSHAAQSQMLSGAQAKLVFARREARLMELRR